MVAGSSNGSLVSNSQTITLAGALTTSGANPLTLTTTGSTNVTFPTSGTLATTAGIPSFPLSVANGGTSLSTLTAHALYVGNGTSAPTALGVGTTGQALVAATGADPAFGTLPVAGGGTSLTTLTAHALYVGNGTSAPTALAVGTTGQALVAATGADPAFGTLPVAGGGTGAVTLTGVLTGNGISAVTANAVTNHGVLLGGASNAVSSLAAAATGTVLQGSTGADPAFTATPTVTSITFGAGTALSNYAEGTWTPTVVGASVAGSTTYTVQNGYYTRIGNQVTIWSQVSYSAATGTGNILFGGFPFTIKSQSNYAPICAVLASLGGTLLFPTGATYITLYGLSNSITAQIYGSGTGIAGGNMQMANTSATWEFTLTYQI